VLVENSGEPFVADVFLRGMLVSEIFTLIVLPFTQWDTSREPATSPAVIKEIETC
jgi:hypothetical protein